MQSTCPNHQVLYIFSPSILLLTHLVFPPFSSEYSDNIVNGSAIIASTTSTSIAEKIYIKTNFHMSLRHSFVSSSRPFCIDFSSARGVALRRKVALMWALLGLLVAGAVLLTGAV